MFISSTHGVHYRTQNFAVHCTRDSEEGDTTAILVTLTLDGKLRRNRLLKSKGSQPGEIRFTHISSGPHHERRIGFGSLQLSGVSPSHSIVYRRDVLDVDDDTLLDEPGATQSIGEIKLEVQRATVATEEVDRPTNSYPAVPQQNRVHETLKKAGEHCVM